MTDPSFSASLSRSERRRRAVRRQICEAALDLFEEKGFDAVTADEISAQVNISQRTFYRHFRYKEDVLLLYGDERREEFAVLFERIVATGTPMPEALSEALRRDARIWEDEREFFRRTARIRAESAREQSRHTVQGKWAMAILAAPAPDLGRDDADPELTVVSETFAAAFRTAQRQWHERGAVGSLVELLEPSLPLAEATYRASSLPRGS